MRGAVVIGLVSACVWASVGSGAELTVVPLGPEEYQLAEGQSLFVGRKPKNDIQWQSIPREFAGQTVIRTRMNLSEPLVEAVHIRELGRTV